MRIVYVVGGLPFGGVETWLLTVVKELRKNGHEPVVINISGTGSFEAEFLKNSITPLHIGNSHKVQKTFRLDTTLRLRKLLRQLAPEIIHTAHFSANYHARLAAIGLGIPVVTHLRNIKRERGVSRRVANRLLSYATDLFLSVSKAVEEEAVKPFNPANCPSKVLHNAIDLERLDASPEVDTRDMLRGHGPLLLSACRLVPQKNMDLLIRAYAQVRAALPDAELLILGGGPERPRLEQLAAEAGVADGFHLPGFTPNVAGVYKSAGRRQSLFVMPSAYEGFGIAPLEAFHFGIPALISPFVPIGEIAGDAALVCGLEPGEIAEKALGVLRDPARWEHMSATARTVAADFSIPRYVARLLDLYGEMLARKGP